MKIAYLSTFYPFRGGIAQFNASLYRTLERSHEIRAFTFKRQYPNFLFPGTTQYVTENDNADELKSFEILDTVNPFSYLKTARKINAFSPDLLIMKYWMPFLAPALGTVARNMKKKTKVISILDNVIPHEKKIIDKPFNNFFLKQNDGFVVMSNSVCDDLISLTSKDVKYLRTDHPIYNHFGKKLDKKLSQDFLKISPNKKTILFFGIIRDYKGLDLLIEAFGGLDKNFQLIIAGEYYGNFEKYKLLINQSPNVDNIHIFKGYIADKEVPYFFSAADVCVLPYKSATQSGITSIAYHFDLPLIATDTGGLKESLIGDKSGLIVPRVNSESIKNSIEEYFNKNLKEYFIKNIKILKENKSWENFAEKIIEFYEEIKNK